MESKAMGEVKASGFVERARAAAAFTSLEDQLLLWWSEWLGRTDLTLHTDYFEAGGTAESARAMLLEVRQRMGIRLILSEEDFEYTPTVLHLAEMVSAQKSYEDGDVAAGDMQLIWLNSPLPNTGNKPPIFLMPTNADEGTGFRRLAAAMPDQPMALVRPGHNWHRQGPYTTEDAAASMVQLVKAEMAKLEASQQSFLVGGFCFGGFVAFEAAHSLQAHGCAGVVMFDTPVPGYPRFWWKPKHFPALRSLWTEVRKERHKPGWSRRYGELLLYKAIWQILNHTRPLVAQYWDKWLIRGLHGRAKRHDLPYIHLRALNVPILHFVAAVHEDPIFREGRLHWQQACRKPVEMVEVRGTHGEMFFRKNIPRIADRLERYLGTGANTATYTRELAAHR